MKNMIVIFSMQNTLYVLKYSNVVPDEASYYYKFGSTQIHIIRICLIPCIRFLFWDGRSIYPQYIPPICVYKFF